jgi:hypothetical protein
MCYFVTIYCPKAWLVFWAMSSQQEFCEKNTREFAGFQSLIVPGTCVLSRHVPYIASIRFAIIVYICIDI